MFPWLLQYDSIVNTPHTSDPSLKGIKLKLKSTLWVLEGVIGAAKGEEQLVVTHCYNSYEPQQLLDQQDSHIGVTVAHLTWVINSCLIELKTQ